MSKKIIKKADNKVKPVEPDEVITETAKHRNPFFSFRYSYKSMSSFGGKTYIKAKEKRFANGKFESEEFEGTMDGGVFDNAVKEMEDNLSNLVSSFFKPLSFFLKK